MATKKTNNATVPEPSQVTNNPATVSSIEQQSQAIIANAAKGATQAKTDLANAKADQASQIASNTALASSIGGTVNPGTGIITPPKPPTGAGNGAPVTPVTPTDISGNSAGAILASGLAAWGLSDLAPMVQSLITQGINTTGIADAIRKTPSYAARFPAMATLNAKGMGISESQYIAKESADREMLYTYLGDHAQAYDNPAQLGTLMTNFVSTNELQTRLQAVHDAANASPDTKAWLKSTYGYSDQDLAAAWLDPNLATDTIARRQNASFIGGAGLASGFGQLTQAQAEALASQGVTQAQAQSQFAKIGNFGQLEQNLPGNDAGSISQQDILNGAFQGGAAGAKLAAAQNARIAQFQANGGAVADATGVSGLRTAAI